MATKKLKLTTDTTMFGTDVWLSTPDDAHRWSIGQGVSYDPTTKLSKKLTTGYLFRSPNVTPERLGEIWDTVETFTGKSHLSAEYDDKAEEVTAYFRIEEKGDATMFAFTHNIFEKWSDEKTKEAKAAAKKKRKAVEGKLNPDGTVRITIEAETLGD